MAYGSNFSNKCAVRNGQFNAFQRIEIKTEMIKTWTFGIFLRIFCYLTFAVAFHLRAAAVFADILVIICVQIIIHQKNQILCAGKKHQRRKQYGEQQFHCDKIKAISNPENAKLSFVMMTMVIKKLRPVAEFSVNLYCYFFNVRIYSTIFLAFSGLIPVCGVIGISPQFPLPPSIILVASISISASVYLSATS